MKYLFLIDHIPRILLFKETAGYLWKKLSGKVCIPSHGDKNRLEQVVQNLLANAIRYSPEYKEVALHVNKKRP